VERGTYELCEKGHGVFSEYPELVDHYNEVLNTEKGSSIIRKFQSFDKD